MIMLNKREVGAYGKGYRQGYKDAKANQLIINHKPHEIGYDDCANALLKMWIDNVLTDGEYYRIADKLNEKWGKIEISESYNKETT